MTEGRPIFVPEYLVVFPYLIELAKEYGLELVEKTNFGQLYNSSN